MPTKKEFQVDLKWSLWSLNDSEFPDEVLFEMQMAFEGDLPAVIIRTHPRKEIRFGSVEVYKGGADVCFYFEWDDPRSIQKVLSDLSLSQGERDFATDRIAAFYSEMTWQISRVIAAGSFVELMEQIDQVESDLMELEIHQSKALDSELEQIAKTIRAGRKKK